MVQTLYIAEWNANGLPGYGQLEIFVNTQNIDIILICETRCMNKNVLNFEAISNHPSSNANVGGSAYLFIIIKSTL